jgi:ubiquinol-cytochrome c reductase iron-sulfur subunit
MSDDTDHDRPAVPAELPLPRYPLASRAMADAFEAVVHRPTDPEGHTHPAPAEAQDPLPRAQWDPASERRAAALVVSAYLLSVLGSALFVVAYVFIDVHGQDYGLLQNLLLGTGLGIAMLGAGIGMILTSKKLVPAVKSEQTREPHHSPEEDELAAEEQLVGGVTEMGLGPRRFVRRSMLLALGVLPVPFIVALRDTGPRPGDRLRANSWRKGSRLLDLDTLKPIKLGDIEIGGVATVVPEGGTDTELPVNAESVVVLIHLPPGVNHPLRGRADWAVADHVAYSKICTHAGCPVGLFEQQTHHLLCPCHQSTFDVPNGCRVIFGPAARPLPQLPIYADEVGYLRARRPFGEALGPSFWARNSDASK